MKLIGAALCLLAGLAAIAHAVWWPLAHNVLNNSCPVNLYYIHHQVACNVWDRASGIEMGVTIPLMLLGIFGTAGLITWHVFNREDK